MEAQLGHAHELITGKKPPVLPGPAKRIDMTQSRFGIAEFARQTGDAEFNAFVGRQVPLAKK